MIGEGAHYFTSRLMRHVDMPYERLLTRVKDILFSKYGSCDEKDTFLNTTVGKTAWISWRKDIDV